MREIKFRAYDKNTKIMLPVVDVIKFTKSESINILRDGAYGVGVTIPYQPQIELMEYTGLHDKNGKEIYEGDITDDGYNNIGVVKYGKYNCSCCEGVYGWYVDGGDIRSAECFLEVIGNIYENSNLLKGADNIE